MKKYIFAGVAVAVLAVSVLLISQQAIEPVKVEESESAGTALPTVITGVYEYSEFAPPNQTWIYTLTREQMGADTSSGRFYIKGFATHYGMRVKLETVGDTTNVIFRNDEPLVDGTKFVEGDVLISFKVTSAGNYVITWDKLKSNLVNPGVAEFKKVTESKITIMVPKDIDSYDTAIKTAINDCGGDSKCVVDAVKTTSFVKKELTIPYKYNTIEASALAAANLIPTQGGTLSILYLKIQDGTAYVLLNIHEDGWAGVSMSLAKIEPIIKKTLLQFPEIKKVLFKYAPASASDTKSGIIGYVHVGPTCPVERVPADPNCADKPVANKIIWISGTNGRAEADPVTVTTDSTGHFTFLVSSFNYTEAHSYLVEVSPKAGTFPRCVSKDVSVTPNQFTNVDISCDSGIR